MVLLIWIIGGALALGQLAESLPPRTWWLLPLAVGWMVAIVPVTIFSMDAGHPWRRAALNACRALRSYLFVMALICIPAAVLALLSRLAG
ncbi:hypothetical protein E5S69_11595 [Cupriavidus necator]|uniref:hypothetical protein n=1 Tax=Cupriavidus necator TaxID=106590 RepID=UPI00148F5D85|nr:hypothetical protein [Cupriavidus necator]NOV24155.1 hypothetical protein [Cupriavidus necator]